MEVAAGNTSSPAMLALKPIPILLRDKVTLKRKISRADRPGMRCFEEVSVS